MKQFIDLKVLLINIEDLRLIDPNVFLTPFLDVIRSDETTGQITSLALSALNKFLSYGLIGKRSPLRIRSFAAHSAVSSLQIRRTRRCQQQSRTLPMR